MPKKKITKKPKSHRISKLRTKKRGFVLFRLPVILTVFLLALIPFIIINVVWKLMHWRVVDTKKLERIDWKKTRFSEVASTYAPPPGKLKISFGKVYGKIINFW